MAYELSCTLNGHKGDVLGLAVTHDDHVVSCSRDKTAKQWLPENSTGVYVPFETYLAEHNVNTKYLTCVCVIPPNDTFQKGLIVAGGSDNNILMFEPDSAVPIKQLCGHRNTVCKVVNSIEMNVILSASWDTTVKIWKLSPQASKCVRTIEFPQTSVWAVLHTKGDLICAGTADKLVRVFSFDGKLLRILSGHEDCVRDLAEVNGDEILSCSNDSTIRRWSVLTGACLEILYGHPNYIYSVRISGDLIASSGEDGCLLLWTKGHHLQTINLPARSVWAVVFLSNKDIVVGSSDGSIRIFTTAKERQADQETLEAFRKASTNFVVPFKRYMGCPKISRLPGPEVLKESGIQEGQTRIVRDDGKIICYSWCGKEKVWKNVENIDLNTQKLRKTSDDPIPICSRRIRVPRNDPKGVYICAICRKSFSRKSILRRHCQKTNHSIANIVPSYLRSVLPKEWHYCVCKFRRKGTKFKAEICLSINTVTEVHEWIRKFCDQSKQMYRRYSTKRSARGLTAYAEFYKCQHAFQWKKSKKRRSNRKACKSTINLSIKRDSLASLNYTKVNLNFAHNHLVDHVSRTSKVSAEVFEEKFRSLFENGFTPISALCAFKEELRLHDEGSSSSTSNSCNACPSFSWVKSYYRRLYGDVIEEADTKENGDIENKIAPIESVLHCVKMENSDLEEESPYIEYILPDEEEMITEMEVEHDSDAEVDDEQLLRKLQKRFDNFIVKLEEDDVRYFKTGILSMCNELKKACQASARSRLSALLSFNKTEECR